MVGTTTTSMDGWADGWTFGDHQHGPPRPFRDYLAERGDIAMADKAERAREMIKAEADHLVKKQIAARGELRDARTADIDYQRGVIDGLRKAGDLLGEGS